MVEATDEPEVQMAEILMLHHAQGRTPGVLDLSERLAAAGHVVHVPDLYAGLTFPTVADGVAHAQQLGNGYAAGAESAVADLPADLVYLGWSLGVMSAQHLAQNRPGARGLVALESFVDPSHFGAWPEALPVQIHGMVDDEWFAEDRAVAEEFVAGRAGAELFVYPGEDHLFADDSLPAFDAGAAELLLQRVLDFLDRATG